MLVLKIAAAIVLAFIVIEVGQFCVAVALFGAVARSVPTPRVFAPTGAVRTLLPRTVTPTKTTSPTPRTLVAVATWTGTTSTDTPRFTTTDDWRIEWEATAGTQFSVMLMNNSGFPATSLVSTRNGGSGTTGQRSKGTYYLKVTASAPWKITVSQAIP